MTHRGPFQPLLFCDSVIHRGSPQRAAPGGPGGTGLRCRLMRSGPGAAVIHYLRAACPGIPTGYEDGAVPRIIRNKNKHP